MEKANTIEESKPLIIYDGYCNLCNGWVQFILKKDRNNTFLFTALSSETSKRIFKNTPPDTLPDSVLLRSNGEILHSSSAALGIVSFLPYPWKALLVFKLIPRSFLDWGYRAVARNRYKWFGKSDHCQLPPIENEELFLP